jgi:hypothetical protein
MRKVREVLRLKYACGASDRVIARSVGIGRTTVGEYIRRAAVVGITWPIPVELDDTALERKLFAPAGYNPPRAKPLLDWNRVHAELRRRGVTLAGSKDCFTFIGGDLLSRSALPGNANSEEQRSGCIGGYPK